MCPISRWGIKLSECNLLDYAIIYIIYPALQVITPNHLTHTHKIKWMKMDKSWSFHICHPKLMQPFLLTHNLVSHRSANGICYLVLLNNVIPRLTYSSREESPVAEIRFVERHSIDYLVRWKKCISLLCQNTYFRKTNYKYLTNNNIPFFI